MIETTNPEIDVEELMTRVRREAAKLRQRDNGHAPARVPAVPVISLPPLADLPAPPALGSSGPLEVKKDRLDALLKQARDTTEVSGSIPKFLRGLFRKQGGYNRALLDTVAALAKTNVQLNKRVQELQSAAQQHHDWIRILVERRQADADWMKTATPAISAVPALQERIARADERLQEVESEATTRLDETTEVVHTLRSQGERQGEHLRNLQAQSDREGGQVDRFREDVGNWRKQTEGQGKVVHDLREQAERQSEHLGNLQDTSTRTGEHLRNLQGTADRLLALFDQNERAAEHLRNLQVQADRHGEVVHDLREQAERQSEHLGNLQDTSTRTGEHLRNLQGTADRLLALFDQNERAAEHLRNLQVQTDRQGEYLQSLRAQAERQDEHLRNLQDESTRAGEHLRNLQSDSERASDQLRDLAPVRVTTARLEAEIAHLADFRRTLGRLEERQASDAVYLKGQIAHHTTLLQQWLTTARPKKAAVGDSAALPDDAPLPAATDLDAFYVSFENRFRGSRSEIKERVRFYLPLLKKAKAGTAARPILDVGCGRGEWLELLEDNGLHASGVDLNTAMVTQCRERKFDVQHADAIAHLRLLPANSHGCVSGFHIIEHLPFEMLLELFMQTLRVLKPGGLAIFESPNCKNLMVGACYFNVDPTHRNPVFPETASFILETQGFTDVRLEYLSPAERPFTNADHDAEMLNDLLFGPQDFAVIGRKPAAR